MDKLKRYLSDVYNVTKALYQTKKASKLNVVLGNVSGDMDSVVCCIVLGYYQTYKDGFYSEEEKGDLDPESLDEERLSKLYIPIINMQKHELEARTDIIYHFDTVGINKDEIVSMDMVDVEHYANENKLQVFLVDHNLPDCNQEYLTPHVTGILDHHHEKDLPYGELRFKDIRFCGSAASLVTNVLIGDSDLNTKLVDSHVAWFCSAPILVDTVNFAEKHRGKKWDQIDEDVYSKVKEFGGSTIPDDYFKQLYFQKTDIDINVKLGWKLLARKDYKNYKMGNGLKFGISTVFLDLKICEESFGASLLHEEFDEIIKERGLDAYIILTHYCVDGDVKRQIVSYSPDKELADNLAKFWESIEKVEVEKIEVGSLKDVENCYIWQNHSTSYSRKKLEPFIREHFKN